VGNPVISDFAAAGVTVATRILALRPPLRFTMSQPSTGGQPQKRTGIIGIGVSSSYSSAAVL
jgi:hypothetical protein